MKLFSGLVLVALTLAPLEGPGRDLSPSSLRDRDRPRVERVINRGHMIELIVSCRGATGVIVFSRIEKLFCTPHLLCHRSFALAARALCQRDVHPLLLR